MVVYRVNKIVLKVIFKILSKQIFHSPFVASSKTSLLRSLIHCSTIFFTAIIMEFLAKTAIFHRRLKTLSKKTSQRNLFSDKFKFIVRKTNI